MTWPPRSVVVAAGAIVAAVVVASPLHTPLNNPNEGVRVYTARAVVEHHTLAIDAVSREWGFIDDKAQKNGRTYQSKAPLPALLGAAAYAVVHPVTGDLSRPALTRLCRVAVMVPVALMLALCWWALRRSRDDSAFDDNSTLDVVMLGLMTGTGVLAALQVFSGHALAAIAPAAVLGLARLRQVRGWHHVVAGVLLGVAASSEYPAALCAPLVWLVTRRDAQPWRALGLAVVGAIIALLPTLLVHQLMWGAPWRTGYSFLDNPHYRPLVEGTFFGIGLPDPQVWMTTLVSPELGLFFFSPFLAVGVVGLLTLPRHRRAEQVVVVAVVVAFLLFIGGFRAGVAAGRSGPATSSSWRASSRSSSSTAPVCCHGPCVGRCWCRRWAWGSCTAASPARSSRTCPTCCGPPSASSCCRSSGAASFPTASPSPSGFRRRCQRRSWPVSSSWGRCFWPSPPAASAAPSSPSSPSPS
jgi:hypothetical protein